MNIIKHEQALVTFTDDQVKLIKQQIAPNANQNELQLFLYQCQRTGLDPLTRQIYCIHRGGKMTIQTSIDGFRVIAERSGNYAGQSEPEFIEEQNKLVACKVRVFKFSPKGDRYEAAVGVAYWSEYVQEFNGKVSGLWAKMPHTMLAKVAEALALRKAFPQDLSGLYTGEEMAQADAPKTEETTYEEVPTTEEKQLLKSLAYNTSLKGDDLDNALKAIDDCRNYKMFEKIEHRLESLQLSIDEIPNPNQADINKHLKKVVG
jgi:phage recombination protein Bet